MLTNIKCAITTAILSVLIFLLLLDILEKYTKNNTNTVTDGIAPLSPYTTLMNDDKNMFQSIEMVMLVSVFLAFNLNNFLFNYCTTLKM